MLIANIGAAAVITIALSAAGLVAAAFYALVKVQGDRLNDARDDFTRNIENLDKHIGERMGDLSSRLEQRIDGVGDRVEASHKWANGQGSDPQWSRPRRGRRPSPDSQPRSTGRPPRESRDPCRRRRNR